MRIKSLKILLPAAFLCAAVLRGAEATSGVGTASIVPLNVVGGGVVTATATYVVPAGGLSMDAMVEFAMPLGWYPYPQTSYPGMDGYATVSSTDSTPLIVNTSYSSPTVMARVGSGSIPAGTHLKFTFLNVHPNCPMPNQTQTAWTVRSATAYGEPLSEIAVQPIQNIVAGSAQWINYSDWNSVTVAAGQSSKVLVLQASDNCGRPAAVNSSLNVNLSGWVRDMTTYMDSSDSGAQFALSPAFTTAITSVTISTGASSASFYYRTTTYGTNLSIRGDYLTPVGGWTQQLWRYVSSLSAAPDVGSTSVDTGVPVVGQKTVTLSPDGSGVNNQAYIRFAPSDSSLQWRVIISSDGFQTLVYERWGTGDPLSNIFWDGRDTMHSWQVVPNGTYDVKIEIGGVVGDSSLSIVVNSAQISGTITLGGSPVSGANVNAQAINTSGYGHAMTDANGQYTLNGLRSGTAYNLQANYYDPSNQAMVSGQLNNVTAPATGKDFSFSTPAVLRIVGVASSSRPVTSFGYLNIHTADYSKNYYGSLRLLSGATTSDNGDYFNSSSWTAIGVEPGTYVIHLQIEGLGADDQTVAITSGQRMDVVLPMAGKASVFGKVQFPSALTNSTWVSIEGVRKGNNYPTVWGGVYLNAGQSQGIYSMYAVDAGTYTLRARASGFAAGVLNNVIVGSADIGDSVNGGANFPVFSLGGHINGTVTINGDTSELSDPLTVWLNGFSPTTGDNVFTQVLLSTSATSTSAAYSMQGVSDGTYNVFPPYLQGFQPPSWGPQAVTVSGGAGSLDLTLTQNSASISGSVILPGSQTDYSNVHLTLQGSDSRQTNLSAATYSLDHLGTGFYTLVATYLTTGAQVRASIPLTNGQSYVRTLDLSVPTYSVSGQVSIQSGFTVRGSSGTPVSVNTIADLLANATNQLLQIGLQSLSTTTARVEAFPKTFDSYQSMNRSGFANTFGVGEYKFGVIESSGAYSISGLSPGIWEVNVYPYFDNGTSPNVATLRKTITVGSHDVTGTHFPLSKGYSVSGTINLPTGASDVRTFTAQILGDRGDEVQSTQINVGVAGSPASSASYQFSNLPSGNFILLIRDFNSYDAVTMQNVVKYVGKPVAFSIESADKAGVDVDLGRAASIVGKIGIVGSNADGTPNLTLITSSNRSLLPSNFNIFSHADPWVPGGEGQTQFDSNGKIQIDSNNQFRINGLVPGTYSVTFRQESYGMAIQGAGSVNLAAYVKGSVVVAEGQTVDLGTISLKTGLSLSGTVTDQSGQALSNIKVRAMPATDTHGDNNIETYTDAAGKFTVTGLDPVFRIYNIVAAPRPYPSEMTAPVPYGQITKMAVDVTKVPAPALNFVLPPATASLIGSVATVDSGSLSYPDGDKERGYPVAAVYLRSQGLFTGDNPLGDSNTTDLSGNFDISNLVAGTYDVTVMSLGYRPIKLTGVKLGNGAVKDLGALTLQKGPQLTVTLSKPDGTSVNTQEVNMAVAVTPDVGSLIFGQTTSDVNTGNIASIKFGGFELSPKTYNILLFDKQDNIISPPEGRGLVFTHNDDVVSKAITFRPSAPFAYANVKKVGSGFSITYYLSRPLRNRGDDQDPTLWVTVLSGQGVLSDHLLSGDRRQFTVLYTPPEGEQNARIRFQAYSVDVDPSTGVEFILSKTITLLLGHKASSESNINPALGGSVSLVNNDDPASISIPSNALLTSTGSAVDAGTSYSFTFTATDDADSVAGASGRYRAAALPKLMARGSAAFVSEAYAAMSVARASSEINPLSSFYSVLLPAGLSHTLNQTSYLTLSYDSTADPSKINIYYFDGTKYLLESNERTVDSVNHTITVGVSHFSTFVVLENDAPIVVVNGDSGSGGDIQVFNFPNPFDLQAKTKTLSHGGTTPSLSTDGTIIRYFIPAAKAGSASIDIYDVAGQKVRSISLGSPSADVFHYAAWDGKNDGGNKVASGVYIGVLKVAGEKKFWKMAVIK